MKVKTIQLLNTSNEELVKISKDNLLALSLEEMVAIKKYFVKKRRNPTDIELETIAQTWSEHCKHKTLTGKIEYREAGFQIPVNNKSKKNSGQMASKKNQNSRSDPMPEYKVYNNLLKETVFRVTKELNKKWCISVFKDNAGIIEFNDKYGIAFKVETHNHPSAIEPYGGSATGIGGVIRDILGVGKGAKPILNTDVFCFGPIDYPYEKLLQNVFHPKRIFKGVVSGVRDYGNRMGIPTANGAIWFDKGYVYNPLVYCGTVGIIPKEKSFKKVSPGDVIISVGGRTGRDGIHGATFSSLALDKDTPLSPVQIGNPIIEKKVTDTVLQARDLNLYSAITDCGAGGFSSAIGELGKDCGVRVELEKAPLKYTGLLPWEIWVSEAQERMVLTVPKKNVRKILKIFSDENVEATILGEFTNTKKLEVFYKKSKICDLYMHFLHEELPKRHYQATWNAKENSVVAELARTNSSAKQSQNTKKSFLDNLHKLLSSPNICSKEWVIRQYDHEVQGQTILKPLQNCLPEESGPGDACVILPISSSDSYKGIAVACGINPDYGKIDPYWMAASSIDETLRNLVCVGGNIKKAALLDNFCWGKPEHEGHLAGLVRAAQACYDIAKVFETPFISGKDSLNNDYVDEDGKMHSIPATLLISGISIVDDIRKVVSMYLKEPENLIYIVGITKNELVCSQYNIYCNSQSYLPTVNPKQSLKQMLSINKAMKYNLIRSCHDCSDGGLAVALAEMSFSGGYGIEIDLDKVPFLSDKNTLNFSKDEIILFSESNSRFILEIKPENKTKFELTIKGNIFSCIGTVRKDKNFIVKGTNNKIIIKENIEKLKKSWQTSLQDKL